MFCTYDDYNWDWSLLALSVKCFPTKIRTLVASSPRVIHIGDCGVHTHRCELHNAAFNTLDLFKSHESEYFPKELKVTEIAKRMLKPSKPNGGWGDLRDRQLCLMNTYPYNSSLYLNLTSKTGDEIALTKTNFTFNSINALVKYR